LEEWLIRGREICGGLQMRLAYALQRQDLGRRPGKYRLNDCASFAIKMVQKGVVLAEF
jgi:hypothetical protein